MPKRPKFNYDSEEFYDEIGRLAMQGLTDKELSFSLAEKFGNSLSPQVFSYMKNGHYSRWTEKENKCRSERILSALCKGRCKINAIVRSTYLQAALGGKKITSSVVPGVVMVECACGGEDETCEVCGGRGYFCSKTQTNIRELPPDVRALSSWLYHRDEEYRKIERMRGKTLVNREDSPQDSKIDEWVKGQVR